jgi:hypothetical protein
MLNPKTKTRTQRNTGSSALCRLTAFCVFAFVALALLTPSRLSAADSPETLEYRVKAGYLFNFAKYVEWPISALSEKNSPIIIGVLDGAEAMPVIQQVLANKRVNEHPIIVKAVVAPSFADGCHILFVSRTANYAPADVRQVLGSSATLLVGETGQFAEDGGMIGFIREADTLRVTLNLEATTWAGLKVSSKLASVAKVVKTKK